MVSYQFEKKLFLQGQIRESFDIYDELQVSRLTKVLDRSRVSVYKYVTVGESAIIFTLLAVNAEAVICEYWLKCNLNVKEC